MLFKERHNLDMRGFDTVLCDQNLFFYSYINVQLFMLDDGSKKEYLPEKKLNSWLTIAFYIYCYNNLNSKTQMYDL